MAFAPSAGRRMSINPMLRILDKPAGITTHTSLSQEDRASISVDPIDSFLGHLSYRSGRELFPVHRLDMGTTGILLATDTSEEAAELAEIFESRKVEKKYLFVTDRKLEQGEARVESFIDRHSTSSAAGGGSNFFSIAGTFERPANAVTDFKLVNSNGTYSLWEAKPLTGRPHQIRLQAEQLGIPILGDGEHGGGMFPALCLHASSVRLSFRNDVIESQSPRPRWFDHLTKLDDRSGLTIVNWLASIERRERLARSLAVCDIAESETVRLIHSEGQDLRCDRLGTVVQLHWYGAEFDLLDREAVTELARIMNWPDWYVQTRPNRGGKNPVEAENIPSRPDLPSRWQAQEESLTFTFRRDTSMSSGLFLDQRANRRWVNENSKDLRVLNLFSYTGGFSVAAAKAGAAKVVSVDLSKNFLNWSRENFEANGISLDASPHEFRAMEARDYLKWAKKKDLQFDLVICDPPSFARTASGVFQIEKEFEMLLQMCVDVTAPQGRILFSLNYELLSEADVFLRTEEFVRLLARRSTRKVTVARTPSPDLDFEFPREARSMKSFFLEIET